MSMSMPMPMSMPMKPTTDGPLPIVSNVPLQPLGADVRRIIEACRFVGEPLSPADESALLKAIDSADAEQGSETIQRILDRHCLFAVDINPEMRVKVAPGPAAPLLVEQGWSSFLVKVANESGTTAALRILSPQARSVHNVEKVRTPSDVEFGETGPNAAVPPVRDAWLDLEAFDSQPLLPTLTGLTLEYRMVQLYSRDAGKREAKFVFDVGQGTQDLGFRSETDVLFTCRPAREITLRVADENGHPTTASFVIRDPQGRIYPSLAKRLAPDFAFQPQIYRTDGEKLRLPDGNYAVEFRRGPESLKETRAVTVNGDAVWTFQVRRWIDPSLMGWWSGDHHIHAAGCAHYTCPSEGVLPADMARHCRGEDLKIGANLTWGPGFDYQKQFFTGAEDKASEYPYILRYDIEVSGFGSHLSGHLCLLRLRQEIYPGGDSSAHWPTLGLNTIRWAKAQGAVVGTAHSGLGLRPDPPPGSPPGTPVTEALPNYIIPPFNGVGANEYVVDVTHEVPGPDGKLVPAIDFYSLVDTPYNWELNMWYHTLNAGFRTRAAGETDFPCLYGDRVGRGRSYVKLDGKLSYDAWCEGVRAGRSYVSDGESHLLEFSADQHPVGVDGSEVRLDAPRTIPIRVKVAALLAEKPDSALHDSPLRQKPWWDLERARIGTSRNVPVELVVNGEPVQSQVVAADGTQRDVTFNLPVQRSSWVAVRIRASSHTNPIFVVVGGKPIRASRRSVEWCLAGVEKCWAEKKQFIAPAEMPAAVAAYDHARAVYRQRLAECDAE
jgi:hypothetical protein